jgi:hypothetical protein
MILAFLMTVLLAGLWAAAMASGVRISAHGGYASVRSGCPAT